ncbi:MAG TPA: hypothetical protein DHV48_12860 [Prolixibacteraceae bacterium]|nr:hypothetical protein [Prolixibacteraceae bacterium]
MAKRNRKDKATRHLKHFQTFHKPGKRKAKFYPVLTGVQKPTKSIDDLTDYEIDQIWAEAVHRYKTEGFDPEEFEGELDELLKQDPLMSALFDRLNNGPAPKVRRVDAEPLNVF